MTKLEQILQTVRTELGADFVATDVVGMDGLSIAGVSTGAGFDSSAASARFAMVMKLASRVVDKIGMGVVDDSLVTTDRVYILTRFLGDSSYYWGLSVTKEATLGMVRMLMDEYADQLWAAIPR